jgi:hypothetical protein
MNKQTLVVVIGAIALLGLGIAGAMAFTGSSGSDSPVMTMPDGSTMPSDQMTSTGGTHTMQDGETMTGMNMNP